MSINVAIQGIDASFHDIAARKYFREQQPAIQACSTFVEVCQFVTSGRCDFGLIALHNTIAGPLTENYQLLLQYPLWIRAQVVLPIEHHLMALANETIESICAIWSHPVALRQCTAFMTRHADKRVVEQHDTAGSARDIAHGQLPGIAAIASKQAAEAFGLTILAEHVGDQRENLTRFAVVQGAQRPQVKSASRATVVVKTDHATTTELLATTEVTQVVEITNGETGHILCELDCIDSMSMDQLLCKLQVQAPGLRVMGIYETLFL